MSSFDPLAAIVADAALAQSSVAAIDLGVQIEILQQQLAVGDLITATILPPQNGVDLLSLLGQTVQAQLPPGIDPGETLLLQVTGFQGNQILVRNIGVVDPDNPPPTVTVTLPQPEPGAPAQATLYTLQPPPAPQTPQAAQTPQVTTSQQASPAQQSSLPQQMAANSNAFAQTPPAVPPPVAPPRAVFVAASVQKVQAGTAPPAPAPATPAKTVPIVVPPENELALEARIAATRAASIDLEELVNQPGPVKQAPAQTAPSQAPAVPVSPPPIAARATVPAANTPPIAPELTLLARLRIPALPLALAAARLASNAASILPRTLARLDAALAALPQADARAATIRTIAAFLGKLDLGNTRALPEQLMSYVSNVVDGAESKLAALVRALEGAQGQPPPAADDPAAPQSAPAQPRPALAPNAGDNPVETVTSAPTASQAPAQSAQPPQAAERAVALQYDLKAAIVSMIDAAPRGATPQLSATLGEALATLTAVQLGAVNAQNADPSAIVIPLPAFYYEGGRPAQLRISRDAPQGGKKLDADNFHIAFVLDTKSLGTVAVDVQTASRSVSVNVKTEVQTAANRFRDSFNDLRGRLEELHYRVANIAASVAAASSRPEPAETQTNPSSRLDLQA